MILAFAVSAIFVAACNGTKDKRAGGPEFITGAEEVEDTTIYGRCGEGTAMHTLELVTDKGDTLVLAVDTEDGEDVVRGGLLAGDRLAVTAFRNADGEDVASRVLNLTTLLGTWRREAGRSRRKQRDGTASVYRMEHTQRQAGSFGRYFRHLFIGSRLALP